KVNVVDAATGQEALAIRGMAVCCRSVVFSPDGKRLASAGGDNRVPGSEVILWDAATGQEALSLSTGKAVSCLAFSPDGHRLAAACDDTVRVWDATPLPPQPHPAAAAPPK